MFLDRRSPSFSSWPWLAALADPGGYSGGAVIPLRLSGAIVYGGTIQGGERKTRTVAGDQSLIGSIGVLLVATRGKAGPGEVLLKIRGGTEAFLAWSIDPIPKGATVLVIENRGERTVDVSEWADPLDPFPE
jgi:hypothetical protein